MSGDLQLHDAQRRAAEPAVSVWVAASAGAGKTKVLVDRVLRLMLSGTPVEKILCLTFTRAAAAEMSNRIKDALGDWAILGKEQLAGAIENLTGLPADDDDIATARRLFAQVLDVPGGLRIMTIHSFCESLLGRFPLEARVAPHFSVVDERSAAEIMHEARDELLIRAERDGDARLTEALREVTGRVTELEFVDLMTELAGERGRLKHLAASGDSDGHREARLYRMLWASPDETEAGIIAGACAEATFDRVGLQEAADALATGSGRDIARGEAIAAWLAAADDAGRAAIFEAHADALLRKDRHPLARLITKKAADHAPYAAETLAGEAERLAGVFERLRAYAVAVASAALLRLGDGLIGAYEAQKRLRAKLDYDDLILLVRALLENDGAAPWVLYKLDGGVDHILIDEAQDTSPDQWAIVRALADEFFVGAAARAQRRTMFAVGDPKQSIFSFQRAAPEEFDAMRRHFAEHVAAAEEGWDDVGLDISYRSSGSVLRAVDAVFGDADAFDGLGDAPLHHEAFRVGQAGLVEIWPPVMPAPRDEPDPWTPPISIASEMPTQYRLANALAVRIADWIRSSEFLESHGRPLRAGDIMVLVRRRTAFVDDLVQALKTRDIPVAGVDRMVLSDEIAIMDLVALGQFLLLPGDDLTLATVLKGPLIGFDEDQLFTLAHGREDHGLWDELISRAHETPKFAEAVQTLMELLDRTDFTLPFEFYADILSRLGGRRKIVERLGVQANDPLDEFLALAFSYERSHPPSLQGFLHWFAEGKTDIKRDLEHAARDEVRVMTVHGAKGLQAPVVILADTMQTPSQAPKLLWTEDERGPDAGAPLPVWRPRADLEEAVTAKLGAEAKHKRDQEYRRLLYVAMTRAEDRLYVCGYGAQRKAPEGCWYNLIRDGLEDIADSDEIEIDASAAGGWGGARVGPGHPPPPPPPPTRAA
ncbi:MAG: double-strand break repair helicase AddA, partial [Pseudomonadota bacterium]|nr:double-strand break repair helicase AddA [Pseudomonadota bacterium]